MVKDPIRHVPGFGWAARFGEFLFMKRGFAKDGGNISDTLSSFKKTDNPLWVTFFPEGTFVDEVSMDLVPASHKFAAENNLSKACWAFPAEQSRGSRSPLKLFAARWSTC